MSFCLIILECCCKLNGCCEIFGINFVSDFFVICFWWLGLVVESYLSILVSVFFCCSWYDWRKINFVVLENINDFI